MMSHIALQRVIVRMMFDPKLLEAVYSDANSALAGDDISPRECEWLTAVDRRAYAADSHFAARALHGLAGEYATSVAVATRTGAPLTRFFASSQLHSCIQAGSSLSLAFGEWLAAGIHIGDPRVAALAEIERALAGIRRSQSRPHREGEIRLAATVCLTTAQAGALALYEHLSSQFRSQPVDAASVAQNSAITLDIAELGDGSAEQLLCELKPGGQIAIETLNPVLWELLDMARTGSSRSALLACARRQGAEVGEDTEVIEDLIADGLLVVN